MRGRLALGLAVDLPVQARQGRAPARVGGQRRHVQLPLGIAAHRTAQLVELHEQLVLQLRLDMALK